MNTVCARGRRPGPWEDPPRWAAADLQARVTDAESRSRSRHPRGCKTSASLVHHAVAGARGLVGVEHAEGVDFPGRLPLHPAVTNVV